MCAGISAYHARPAISIWSRKPCTPLDNRFGKRISPMSQVHVLGTWCYLCVRPDRGFGICWRAMPDDDEHYCFAVVL
jgi:hypothetical protein